ncbi:hypothetical protein JTE90_020535 [Oedothorax gibbosus]|uniref:Uncharacterized protein n=1 Tax=Oedothorax gibbosus TaxID=931172 RepID=A0AAV6VW27_9ARAC|nr:hypothetical protein JTE90_020535 [Oedothorax gibbosus]
MEVSAYASDRRNCCTFSRTLRRPGGVGRLEFLWLRAYGLEELIAEILNENSQARHLSNERLYDGWLGRYMVLLKAKNPRQRTDVQESIKFIDSFLRSSDQFQLLPSPFFIHHYEQSVLSQSFPLVEDFDLSKNGTIQTEWHSE